MGTTSTGSVAEVYTSKGGMILAQTWLMPVWLRSLTLALTRDWVAPPVRSRGSADAAVITKMDLPENRDPAKKLKQALEKKELPVLQISAVTGLGLKDLVRRTARLLIRTSRDQERLGK